jgi:hypothetical protein
MRCRAVRSTGLLLVDRSRCAGLLTLIVAVAVTGCRDYPVSSPTAFGTPEEAVFHDETPNGQVSVLAAREIRAAIQGRTRRGVEDEILRIEAGVPGFGGFYFDRDEWRFAIHVRDAEHEEAALAASRQLASHVVMRLQRDDVSSQDIAVREGRFGFSELVAWSEFLFPKVLTIPGFVAIGADERRNRVLVRVENTGAQRQVEEILEVLDAPDGVVHVELANRMYAATSLTDRIRPTGGGIEIIREDGNAQCTHGWTVETGHEEVGFVTAAHCSLYAPGSGTPEDVFQGSTSSGDRIGGVHINPAWDVLEECEDAASQTWAGDCIAADAMFVTSGTVDYRVARTSSLGTNNQTGSLTVDGWWESIDEPFFSVSGLDADKVGRTTGWTRGEIESICINTVVTHPTTASQYLVLCMDWVEFAGVGRGDSGGPVFYPAPANGTINPLGVLVGFAGEGEVCSNDCLYVFSAFDMMEYHLGRSLDPSRIVITAAIEGPDQVEEHQRCEWTAQVTGGSGSRSYEWRRNSILVSQTSSYSTSDTGDSNFQLELEVTDSKNHSDFDVLNVQVQGSGGIVCNG